MLVNLTSYWKNDEIICGALASFVMLKSDVHSRAKATSNAVDEVVQETLEVDVGQTHLKKSLLLRVTNVDEIIASRGVSAGFRMKILSAPN